MKTISYKLKDLEEKKEKKVTLKLGYVGENEHVQIRIDCSEIWENYPNAVASLAVEPPEGSKYPAIVTREGNVVCWTVKDSDLVHDGDGRIQLTFTDGSEIQKTVICRTKVDESIIGSGTTPDPIADFVAEANEALAELEAAEVHGPVIGEDGYWYTWSKDAGEYVKTDTKAQGEQGDPGPAGEDGAPGQDGHTPVKGTDYWTQQDQADIVAAAALETVSAVIDDTAGDGDTNKTWSADKIAETTGRLLNAIQGKPELKETDAEDVDLDITDSDGDVLVRFKDGHIQTKEFNSKKIIAVKPTDAVGIDMDIADENGNVLLRLKDGEVITKNFNSGTDCKNVINPYKDVLFASDEEVAVTTHDHAKDQTAVDNLMSKNLDAIAISNYYPSEPYYPLSEHSLTVPAGTIEIPNAEHHSFTDDTSGAMHLNSIGSTFASGSPSGQTPLGVADTWRHGIIKMKRDLLFADGGGVTINHPVWSGVSTAKVIEMLDFDDVVLGIEIYNQDSEIINGKGWATEMWDDILKTGRRCWGFAVPDHMAEGSGSTNWEGKIVLLVPDATQENCLKAIRNGEFYIKIKHTSLALTDLEVEGNSVTIEVSESATIKTIIDGVVVDSSVGTTKNVTIPSKAVYVRFEAETENDKLFTNPIIFKGRK